MLFQLVGHARRAADGDTPTQAAVSRQPLRMSQDNNSRHAHHDCAEGHPHQQPTPGIEIGNLEKIDEAKEQKE